MVNQSDCRGIICFWNEDEVSRRKRRKTRKKINPERKKKKENKREALRASLNYADELGPLRCPGRRSETGADWLSDAGEYCGDTGEDCDADALLNCEYGGDTGDNCEAGV